MNKQEFLDKLCIALSGLPEEELTERVNFYSEMIDDRMEDGLSEEEAILAVGTVEEIVNETVSEIPLTRLVKEKIKPKRKMRAWEIVLLILGSPVWLPLLIAVVAVILSLYAVLWSLIASAWAVFGAFAGTFVGGLLSSIAVFTYGTVPAALLLLGGGLICGGLAIFSFMGCKSATKGMAILTKKIFLWTKVKLFRKESEV